MCAKGAHPAPLHEIALKILEIISGKHNTNCGVLSNASKGNHKIIEVVASKSCKQKIVYQHFHVNLRLVTGPKVVLTIRAMLVSSRKQYKRIRESR